MRFFGTDGIRGEADWLLSNNIPKMLGRAIASLCYPRAHCEGRSIRVAVARDVRLSSPKIERELLHGLLEHDAEVYCLGVLPTPALVAVAQTLNVDFSVMVTASHNPPSNNGLKVFDCNGEKLTPEEEENLDNQILNAPPGNAKGNVCVVLGAEETYIEHIVKTAAVDLSGVIVRLDCANGCTAELAPKIFSRLNATVIADNNVRDGSIVNVGTGSTNMNFLCSRLREGEIGFAFDGDGDRVLGAVLCDAEDAAALEKSAARDCVCSGNIEKNCVKILDGDYFLLSISMLLQKEKLLKTPVVVATELSNGRLDADLATLGIRLERVPVGDKYVLERMKQKGLILGAERSGHVISTAHSKTGDGILSALLLLKARKSGICPVYKPFCQHELNVKTADRDKALSNPMFLKELERIKKLLGKEGRIIVRKSGTEPLIRLMCESNNSNASQFLTNLGKILQNL
jgi:phosphoglucosamine mutase